MYFQIIINFITVHTVLVEYFKMPPTFNEKYNFKKIRIRVTSNFINHFLKMIKYSLPYPQRPPSVSIFFFDCSYQKLNAELIVFLWSNFRMNIFCMAVSYVQKKKKTNKCDWIIIWYGWYFWPYELAQKICLRNVYII